jgi:starch-binding outer membrane protein, SusD/RagB family
MRALKNGSPDMKTLLTGLALVTALVVGACDFHITNPNSPPPIGPNATPDQVQSAAIGTLVALRVDVPRWVLTGAILGREGYRLDTADPRFTTELLQGPLDPSNDAFGGGQWAAEYRAVQSGYQILNVIGSAQLTPGERNGVRGFVHTMQALAFLMVLNAHTEDSIPVDVNRTIDQPLAPFVTNDSAYKFVLGLLDSAKTELQAATGLGFDPGPGFTDFNTPAAFLKFNRGVAARVQAYRASPSAPGANCTTCWDTVITNLTQSFMDTTASLDLGGYHVFSTGNQDTPNGLSQAPASAINLAHPAIKANAELQTGGGALDKRFLAKVTDRPDTFALSGLSSALSWVRYPTPNSSIPILRNEELVLLWAEARLGQGNTAEAAQFINFIRRASGGLDPVTNLASQTTDSIRTVLLKQRLYSLLYEGGHHWIDMRRYGRLNRLPVDRTGDVIFATLPINSFEVQARQ